jgi:hypothetical protein
MRTADYEEHRPYEPFRFASDEFAALSFSATSGFSPVLAGEHDDHAWKANVDLPDLGASGLTLRAVFNIGAEYVSMMAARRESDVLLTEGHDSAWMFPGPAKCLVRRLFGKPDPPRLRRLVRERRAGGPINVDNEFTNFDEPMAETAIGWKGITVAPVYSHGNFELRGEYSYIEYHTKAGAPAHAGAGLDLDRSLPA